MHTWKNKLFMLLLFGDSKTKMARKPRRVKDEEEKNEEGQEKVRREPSCTKLSLKAR